MIWCVKSDSLLCWGELGDIWWRFYTNESAEFGLKTRDGIKESNKFICRLVTGLGNLEIIRLAV